MKHHHDNSRLYAEQKWFWLWVGMLAFWALSTLAEECNTSPIKTQVYERNH